MIFNEHTKINEIDNIFDYLTIYTYNTLLRADINTFGQLLELSKQGGLTTIRGIGRKSAQQINKFLTNCGVGPKQSDGPTIEQIIKNNDRAIDPEELVKKYPYNLIRVLFKKAKYNDSTNIVLSSDPITFKQVMQNNLSDEEFMILEWIYRYGIPIGKVDATPEMKTYNQVYQMIVERLSDIKIVECFNPTAAMAKKYDDLSKDYQLKFNEVMRLKMEISRLHNDNNYLKGIISDLKRANTEIRKGSDTYYDYLMGIDFFGTTHFPNKEIYNKLKQCIKPSKVKSGLNNVSVSETIAVGSFLNVSIDRLTEVGLSKSDINWIIEELRQYAVSLSDQNIFQVDPNLINIVL